MLRFFHVTSVIIKYIFIYLFIRLGFYKTPSPKLARNFFEEAGGSFIKFGQILSLRVDVLPKEYTEELLNLLDQVRGFPYEEVVRIFHMELGASPENIFEEFEHEPFAAASFGQVYRAKFEGEEVAVKVLRPGIEHDVAVDFVLLKILAFLADVFFKINAIPWKETASEFARWTRLELDYRNEVENNEKLYRAQNNPRVVIPKVYQRLSTQRILVQEFIKGIPLSKILRGIINGSESAEKLLESGIDVKQAPRLLCEELTRQHFFAGFYHADPHPGNILLMDDGKIGIVDFGILGAAIPNQKTLILMVKAMADHDYKTASKYLISFGGGELARLIESAFPADVPQEEIDKFMESLGDVYYESVKDKIQESLDNIATMKSDHAAMQLRMIRYAQNYRVRFPKEMIAFFRGLAIIGYMAKHLDYDFKMSEELKKFFAKYNEAEFIHEDPPVLKRIDREVALQKLTNWLIFLFEKDQKLYQVVKNNLARYNVL